MRKFVGKGDIRTRPLTDRYNNRPLTGNDTVAFLCALRRYAILRIIRNVAYNVIIDN